MSRSRLVVCGDFNVDRDSALFGEFIEGAALDDGRGITAEDTEVLFSGRQVLRGGTGYVSDHLGLLARLNCLGA